MKALVDFDIGREFFLGKFACEDDVYLFDAYLHMTQGGWRHAALGSQSGRQAFQGAAQFYRIADLVLRKQAHRVTPRRNQIEKPFFLQPDQGCPDRSPRYTETLDNPELGNTRTRRQFAAQDQFAQAQQRPHRL